MKWSLLGVLSVLAGTLVTARPAAAQPAPPLTAMRVIGVASPGYSNGNAWDPVPSGALATPHNHGGNWLQVAVYEEGYATNQSAYFNGSRMTLVQSVPQVGANRRVYGYVHYYRINTTFTSGTVTSQATSLVFPFRTLSTRMYVQ